MSMPVIIIIEKYANFYPKVGIPPPHLFCLLPHFAGVVGLTLGRRTADISTCFYHLHPLLVLHARTTLPEHVPISDLGVLPDKSWYFADGGISQAYRCDLNLTWFPASPLNRLLSSFQIEPLLFCQK